ncbi:MAG: hypothetical protein NT154_20650, partial [Verrucomicrobia bacterium]|nr:hypothetical protein [Verrucomicrobiota bacterium]
MNRRSFLKVGTGTAAMLLSHPGWCAQTEKAKPGEVEILAQSKARIEQHRKGDGTVTVRDAKGKVLPGARVKVEQLRHDFLFGCNFYMFGHCGKPELEEPYRQRFEALLNYCTLAFYWAYYEGARGKPNYDYTDQVSAWTRAHGLRCKGHPLVW